MTRGKMTLQNRIRRWWYWQKMAKIDRHCRKRGHYDFGCYSVAGSIGDKCQRCGRILWTSWPGKLGHDEPRYQEPSRLTESNWR